MKRRYRTSKRPSRIMKMVHIGDVWYSRRDGKHFRVVEKLKTKRFACYYRLDEVTESGELVCALGWLLPPRYFWDIFKGGLQRAVPIT